MTPGIVIGGLIGAAVTVGWIALVIGAHLVRPDYLPRDGEAESAIGEGEAAGIHGGPNGR